MRGLAEAIPPEFPRERIWLEHPFLASAQGCVMPARSSSSSSRSSTSGGCESSAEEQAPAEAAPEAGGLVEEGPEAWVENEGESTDCDEEVAADSALRGQACLVTASCPRLYPQGLEARKAKNLLLPADYTKEEFLKNFRRTFDAHSTQRIEKATCHDEPHKRCKPSGGGRERHKHIAFKATSIFAHQKIAKAFHRQYGVHISFSFKLNRFVGYLKYLMEPGKKASTDLDTNPAKYPPNLNLTAELAAPDHPSAKTEQGGKKRKRLTFDEVSNVIIEGVGEGPIYSVDGLEKAARSLKQEGKVELWNYLGEMKSVADSRALVAKVWRLHGTVLHPLWHKGATFPLSAFTLAELPGVKKWLAGMYKTHALILSGDGGLGKTNLAEALIVEAAPDGFWFLDDPDDFREVDGLLREGHGLVVDEVSLSAVHPNHIKKLFDLEKPRRVTCRHFNGSIPKGCPRIFITNSDEESFYPKMSKYDSTGVKRRQIFQAVAHDTRMVARNESELQASAAVPSGSALPASVAQASALGPQASAVMVMGPCDWKTFLHQGCVRAHVGHRYEAACAACEEMGVAVEAEIIEFAKEIADKACMKPLEQRRFLKEFFGSSRPAEAVASRGASGDRDDSDMAAVAEPARPGNAANGRPLPLAPGFDDADADAISESGGEGHE